MTETDPRSIHFNLGKHEMLDKYYAAKKHSATRPASTDHGNVAEEALRDWLANFLPKIYGVTNGYIFTQSFDRQFKEKKIEHYDVIIYDQLHSPVLWTEQNPGKSNSGKQRAIPAECVHAVIEVKATFSSRNLKSAFDKLRKLEPLYSKIDNDGDLYPKFLNKNFFTSIVFFELPIKNAQTITPLSFFPQASYIRGTPTDALILTIEKGTRESSGLVELINIIGDTKAAYEAIIKHQQEKDVLAKSLTFGKSKKAQVGREELELSALISWSSVNFPRFAFDLVAKLNGNYDRGKISSFHGFPTAMTVADIASRKKHRKTKDAGN